MPQGMTSDCATILQLPPYEQFKYPDVKVAECRIALGVPLGATMNEAAAIAREWESRSQMGVASWLNLGVPLVLAGRFFARPRS